MTVLGVLLVVGCTAGLVVWGLTSFGLLRNTAGTPWSVTAEAIRAHLNGGKAPNNVGYQAPDGTHVHMSDFVDTGGPIPGVSVPNEWPTASRRRNVPNA